MNHERYIGRQRTRRGYRVRRRVRGSEQRPRLNVYRSHKHIYAQVIDDLSGKTIASANTSESDIKSSVSYGGNVTAAQVIGKVIAERSLGAGVKQVAFDRGSYRFHGRVKALADAAREAGLKF